MVRGKMKAMLVWVRKIMAEFQTLAMDRLSQAASDWHELATHEKLIAELEAETVARAEWITKRELIGALQHRRFANYAEWERVADLFEAIGGDENEDHALRNIAMCAASSLNGEYLRLMFESGKWQ